MSNAAVLDYADRNSKPFSSAFQRAAAMSGAIPLVVGVLAFLVWLMTRSDTALTIGRIDILAGFISVCCGCLLLLRHVTSNWRHLIYGDDRLRRWALVLLTVSLLFLNLPACWFIIQTIASIDPSVIRS